MIVLNSIYPFSASKISKQKETNKIATASSLFIDLVNKTNKTDRSGGRNKYILLRLIYTANTTTYKYGVIDF